MYVMGFADTVTKAYMNENSVFADAFNYLIYEGKAVVDPQHLKEMDTTEIVVPFGMRDEGKADKSDVAQKYRDILKSAVIKQDDKVTYILFGIENQTDIHYAMPVRTFIYDALQYGKQVEDTVARHRKNKKGGGKYNRGEYLSGFYKDDKVIPVITLILHFGEKEWDGPLSLHDMMAVENEKLLAYVQNYQIHLIDPAKIKDEDLKKFSTSLREVIGCIKYSKDKKQLAGFLKDNPRMLMEVSAARVIKTITNTPIVIPEEEERIDMCKAIEDMISDSKAEGKKEGRKEGRKEGKKEGALITLAGLVRDGVLSVKDAALRLNMTESAFEAEMKRLADYSNSAK